MPAIRVESLGKKYKLGAERSGSLRDTLSSFWKRKNEKGEFWALKDVSFEVAQGQAVGIIGRNGAGKSTLLKILSRITHPTEGFAEINGRVSSLLEVGTGFHPELTGRENIYLNGTILGMRRAEVRAKFDEIVAFSGVEKFIDTPIKHYSSGMKVRLAFSVAAHLEPEILIIDEVLAVGDADFQKKCLGKMEEVTGQGRTVLFVSHNMEAVGGLCPYTLVLDKGKLDFYGESHDSIERYISNGLKSCFDFEEVLSNDGTVKILSFTVTGLKGEKKNVFRLGEKWKFEFAVEVLDEVRGFVAGIGIMSTREVPVRTLHSSVINLKKGKYYFTVCQDDVMLTSGDYRVILGLTVRGINIANLQNAALFSIEPELSKDIYIASSNKNGFILNQIEFQISERQ